jgi:predicted DsbA family dithiol-disulfide isomerase
LPTPLAASRSAAARGAGDAPAAGAQPAGNAPEGRDRLRRVRRIRLVAYSDYLCPWCYNASLRLSRLEAEQPDVEVEWRSYLLRPRPTGRRDLEAFRAYTQSWQRPGSEPDAPSFRPWQGDAGPPSHSVPAHLVAKAAAEQGGEAFRRMHARLLRAYFEESRDISDADTLRALWDELGLPAAGFERREDPRLLERVLAEHEEALRFGASGVPSLRAAESDAVITGALPLDTYRRFAERLRERAGEGLGA